MHATVTRVLHALPACVMGVAALSLNGQITEERPMPSAVTVRVDTKGDLGVVPPGLFGTFIEPIENSINNGLMAEILVNGSLEPGLWNHAMLEELFREQPELIASTNRTGIPLPWMPLNTDAGNRYELHTGDAANSWESLEIMGVPGVLTGIAQRVYLPVPRELTYTVSFYAKHVSGGTRMTVSLRGMGPDEAFASASLDAEAPVWTKYTMRLTIRPGQVERLQPVRFGLAVEDDARVDVDQISLMPADAIETFDPDVVRLAQAMHMTELRLGGNFSSYYHWRDGVGPADKRVTMQNIAWGIPEYNNFGTDEFLAFCRLVHATPQIGVNMGSGTPEEAAEWMRYVRERYKGPLLVEMGNELYGHWQVGYLPVAQIADRTAAFSRALRRVPGDVTLLATGNTPNNFEQWNGAILRAPSGTFDLLTTHFIMETNRVQLPTATPEFMAQAAYALPFAVGADFDRMQEQMDAAGRKSAHLAVTEWLFNSRGDGERNFPNVSPSPGNEGGAVLAAGTFNTFMRHGGQVRVADMTGLMEFAGIRKQKEQVFGTPAYYVFGLYSRAGGETLLPVVSDSGVYSVKNGTTGYAEARDVPYIDVVATRNEEDRSITVFCVNRSVHQNEPVVFDLGAFGVARAHVEQIRAGSRYVGNDEADPHRVVPQASDLVLHGAEPVRIALPRESVTVIRFTAR